MKYEKYLFYHRQGAIGFGKGFMLFHVAVLYWKFTGNYPAWTCFADIPFPAGVTPPADEIDESST